MPTPDNDIVTRLQSAGVGTVGTNMFRGGMRPPSGVIPNAAVFVRPTGGVGPLPLLDGGASDYLRSTVQIMVRGDVGSYITTYNKAQSCLDAVQKCTIGGYFQILARNPQPLYLGLDETEHPLFSVNVELYYIN